MGIRAKSDLRNEKIGFKIREHTIQKVPYLIVLGDRERQQQMLTVRKQTGEDLGSMSLADFAERLKAEIAQLSRNGGKEH